MKGLLLSAYDAPSHRRWRLGLVEHLDHVDWRVLTLPPRHFLWRVRGNSLTWALNQQDALEQRYDVVVATSMTDLSALMGLAPKLHQASVIAYFHENQFAYPRSPHQRDDVHPRILNLYTALAADRVVFNSSYNRDSFLEGAATLLDTMPDHVPPGIVERVARRSCVLPVPLSDALFEPRRAPPGGPLRLVWNHRWEYDKAPARLFEALRKLVAQGHRFRLDVVGQQFRRRPPCFERARREFEPFIDSWGFVESIQAYHALLRRADVVVSTALHDFQGLAVLEAVALGCRPLVPDRLAYRDWFPDALRYASYPDDPDRETDALARRLADFASDPSRLRTQPAISLDHLRWSRLAPDYRALVAEVVEPSTTPHPTAS